MNKMDRVDELEALEAKGEKFLQHWVRGWQRSQTWVKYSVGLCLVSVIGFAIFTFWIEAIVLSWVAAGGTIAGLVGGLVMFLRHDHYERQIPLYKNSPVDEFARAYRQRSNEANQHGDTLLSVTHKMIGIFLDVVNYRSKQFALSNSEIIGATKQVLDRFPAIHQWRQLLNAYSGHDPRYAETDKRFQQQMERAVHDAGELRIKTMFNQLQPDMADITKTTKELEHSLKALDKTYEEMQIFYQEDDEEDKGDK